MQACPHTHAPPSVMGGKADTQKIPHPRAEWNLLSLFSFFLLTPTGHQHKARVGLGKLQNTGSDFPRAQKARRAEAKAQNL